jgi:hypothetical protein
MTIGIEQLGGAGIFVAGAGVAVKLLYPLLKNGGKTGLDLGPLYDLHRDTNDILRSMEKLLERQGLHLERLGERLTEHDAQTKRAIGQIGELHRRDRE